MEREDLLRKIAPCSLVCHTCTASKEGVIRCRAAEMLGLLEGFDTVAEKLVDHMPPLAKYADFRLVLNSFAEASCEGCRGEQSPWPDCPIAPCARSKGVDYCFECDEFPCQRVGADFALRERWLRGTRRMREIGAAAYCAEVEGRSHYL